MISPKLQNAMNNQIQAEMFSANLYLAMALFCEGKNLKGFGHWLRIQYQEEMGHAMKMMVYLTDRGGRAELRAIAAPPSQFESPKDVFQQVLQHEQKVTVLINDLYEVAVQERDVAGQIFLQWFVNEQVEEEANANEILEMLAQVNDHQGGIFYIDKELATRPQPVFDAKGQPVPQNPA